jgi:hypothetical protein
MNRLPLTRGQIANAQIKRQKKWKLEEIPSKSHTHLINGLGAGRSFKAALSTSWWFGFFRDSEKKTTFFFFVNFA